MVKFSRAHLVSCIAIDKKLKRNWWWKEIEGD